MESMIKNNFVYLSEHLQNLSQVLNHLFQKNIISNNEREEIILPHKTRLTQTTDMLNLLLRKDPSNYEVILAIFKITGNKNCVDVIERSSDSIVDSYVIPLKHKWWPEEKPLVNSFHERRNSDGYLLVEQLYDELGKNNSCMTVISQNITVSGFGGVGKTTIAKWYASYYQEEYERIIWIDCGEGSLYHSFTKLLADLYEQMPKQNQMTEKLKDMAQACLEILSTCKCLLIYDNAECYVGSEGIKDVLPPKNYRNFHTIITSRNRDWGHQTGHGKIQEFHLDVFSEEESIAFFSKNLIISYERYQLVEVAQILGHLPLALQIAVAALNQKKISLGDYITRIEKTDVIVSTLVTLDDYEKSICKTMNVSLELIHGNEYFGELASNILKSLGYLRPDDNEAELFAEIENVPVENIENAIDLLEKHSLISKVVKNFGVINVTIVNIHRLLQQVIRYNEKLKEKNILKKVLCCKGFLHYKLVPYMHLEKDCVREFYSVKTQLMEKLNLNDLFKERRFNEATKLAHMIILEHYHSETSSGINKLQQCALNIRHIFKSKKKYNKNHQNYAVSLYHYGICLYMERRLGKCLEIFEELISLLRTFSNGTSDSYHYMQILDGHVSMYAVEIWLIHLKVQMGLLRKDELLPMDVDNTVSRNILDLSGNADSIPIDINLLKINNTKNIILRGLNILYDENDNHKSVLRNTKFESIIFNQTTFVNADGSTIENEINLHELPYKSDTFELWDCKNRIDVNLSLLPPEFRKLSLQNVNLGFDSHEPKNICLLTSLKLLNISNEIDINEFFSDCQYLEELTLANSQLHVKFQCLPRSLVKLKLICIELNEQNFTPAASHVKLQSLTISGYSLDDIEKIVAIVQCGILILSSFRYKGDDIISLKQTPQSTFYNVDDSILDLPPEMPSESEEKLLNIINKSNSVAIRNFPVFKCQGLLKLNINTKWRCALIQNGKAREITKVEEKEVFKYY